VTRWFITPCRTTAGRAATTDLSGDVRHTTTVHALKRQALACHRSQKEWLDVSQGMDSYLQTMDDMSLAVGRMSRRFRHAEGWRRHSHLGFAPEAADPLGETLGKLILTRPLLRFRKV